MGRTRIAIVINSLLDGGAERVLQNLLLKIGDRARVYEVHLIVLDNEPQLRRMPDHVVIHQLDARGGMLRSLAELLPCLRELRPALIVSLLVRANVASAIVGRVLRIPSVLCERMHLGGHLAGRYRDAGLIVRRLLPRLTYPAATVILGVSEGVTRNLAEEFKLPERKLRTINNPYDLAAIRAEALGEPPLELPRSYLLAVGRLVAAKNFAMLIDSYLLSAIAEPLVILGDGPERAALQQRIESRGAVGRVLLAGYVENPFSIMRGATMFVSASLNEGFPNALAEAMVLGVPVVATDCRSGPSEILAGRPQGQVQDVQAADYGILVPEHSPELLARAMRLMAEPATRKHYAAQAMMRMESFEASQITEQYWRVIDEFSGAVATPADP